MKRKAGDTIADKYRLLHPLRQGGMGAVWVALHVDLEIEVAIKFIDSELDEDPVLRSRFKREAKAAASLKSPYITAIHDYGFDAESPYMVMELLEGRDLRDLIDEGEVPAMPRLTEILRQLCRGLKLAHQAGVIHRDLKPSNIFLARIGDEEMVKILDFGIAKVHNPELAGSNRTESGVLIGSPRYMSPEQAVGDALDQRSDLWAVTVVVYELITGVSPFDGDNLGRVISQICTSEVPPPSQYVGGLPDGLDGFFERGFARPREDRYQSAEELAEAFAAAVAGTTIHPPRASSPPLPSPKEESGASVEDALPEATPDGVLGRPETALGRTSPTMDATPVPTAAVAAEEPPPSEPRSSSPRPGSDGLGAATPPAVNLEGPPSVATPPPGRPVGLLLAAGIAALVGVLAFALTRRVETSGPTDDPPTSASFGGDGLDVSEPALRADVADPAPFTASSTMPVTAPSAEPSPPETTPPHPSPPPRGLPVPVPAARPPAPSPTSAPAPAPAAAPTYDPFSGLPVGP